MERNVTGVARIVVFVVALVVSAGQAQTYPDTVWVRVLFYDFHSDKSCPEFEMDNNYNVEPGMVRGDVVEYETENAAFWGRDSILKPVYSTQNVRHSRYLKYWYRPWATNAKGDYTIPNYTGQEGRLGSPEIRTVGYDTAFKNIVIPDSLPFVHLGNGMYQFTRTGSNGEAQFFWIDSRGFGNEGESHNYSFTMELHWTFTYEPGLTFEFNGDDDVWVFVNGKLAMDLGGVHGPTPGSFSVDNIAASLGLEVGHEYSFDLFYAERHTVQSTIRITTNIIGPPSTLRLYPQAGPPNVGTNRPYPPLTIVQAGQTVPVFAHVFDSTGTWRPEYDSLTTWRIIDTLGNPPLSRTSGPGTVFSPTKAWGQVTIEATFANPDFPDQVERAVMTVYIMPGPAHHLDIQDDSTVTSRHNNDLFDSFRLGENDYQKVLYAVVRDQYGNYIDHAKLAAWSATDTVIATVSADRTRRWMATVTKKGGGQTYIVASQGSLIPDSVALQAYMPGTNLTSVVTRDSDGDGFLDGLVLHFDSLSSTPAAADLRVVYGNVTFEVESVTGRTGAIDSVFTVTLREREGAELQTGWLPTVSGKASGTVPWYNVTSTDGAGPVIYHAVYYPGNSGSGDTLRVSFSEPVKCDLLLGADVTRAFRYFAGGTVSQEALSGARYAESTCATEFVSGLTIVTSGTDFTFTPFTDSVQLVDIAQDAGANRPPTNARKAPLEIAGENEIQIASSPNPFSPGKTEIPRQTATFYNSVVGNEVHGTVIAIGTKKPLKCTEDCASSQAWYGRAWVYDAVGNLVKDGLRVGRAGQGSLRDYGVYWDGSNRNGRYVGGGGYLVRIEAEGTDGKSVRESLKIGVRR